MWRECGGYGHCGCRGPEQRVSCSPGLYLVTGTARLGLGGGAEGEAQGL